MKIAVLHSGEMFGLHEIFEGIHPKETAISMGFSSVYTLSEHDFLYILKENKLDYVEFS